MNDIIKKLRSLKGLTQEEVAEFIGITRTSYCKKENNPDTFTLLELKKLASILEVQETIFFKDKLTLSVS